MTIDSGQQARPSFPRLLGMPFPWAVAMLMPLGVSLQLVGVSTALSVFADDLAWEFVTEPWVWSRLGFRMLYTAQMCLLLGFAVWVAWCLVGVVQWILRRAH